MSEIKLKPNNCPCCGGHSVLDREDIFCQDCGLSLDIYQFIQRGEAETYQEAREKAIEVWNTRKPMERILERLETELKLAEEEKERCIRENPLQFDSAKGYVNAISVAIEIVKEEGGV